MAKDLNKLLNGKKSKGMSKSDKKSELNNITVGSGIGINELIDRVETIFELVVGVLKVISVPDFDD